MLVHFPKIWPLVAFTDDMVPDFEISPGYNPTGFSAGANSTSVDQSQVAIRGTGGRILAVW